MDTQLVYRYDSITMEYLKEDEVYPVLNDYGEYEYLLPAYTTKVAPPNKMEGQAIIYSPKTDSWSLVEDHRGQTVWKKDNLDKVIVDWFGPIPNTYLLEYPEPEHEYQEWKNGKYEDIAIELVKSDVKNILDMTYNSSLDKPYPFNNYYIIPNWASIYTNTLVAMQQDMNEDGKLDETYYVLLIQDVINQKFVQIKVDSIDEFLPYYNKVKDIYKKLSTEYHNNIVKISLADTIEKLIKIKHLITN